MSQLNLLIRLNQSLNVIGGLLTPITVAYLTVLEFSIAEISFYLVLTRVISLVFEVPSGWLSDRYSRLHVGRISLVVSSLFTIALICIEQKSMLLLVAMFSGLFNALNSGTFDILLFNEIEHKGDLDQYGHIIAKTKYGMIVGLFIGFALAWLTFFKLIHNILVFKLMFVAATVIALAALVYSFKLKEGARKTTVSASNQAPTLSAVMNWKASLFTVFSMLFLFDGYHSIERLFQVYLILNLPEASQLLTITAIYLITAIVVTHSSIVTDYLPQYSSKKLGLVVCAITALASVFLFVSAFENNGFLF